MDLGVWGQYSTFLEHDHVMLHIKLKRITNAATWLPPPPPHPRDGVNRQGYRQRYSTANMKHIKRDFRLRDGDGVKRSKFNFFRTCHVAYQGESRLQQHNSKYFSQRHPYPPGDGVNRSKFKFFRTWSCCISN